MTDDATTRCCSWNEQFACSSLCSWNIASETKRSPDTFISLVHCFGNAVYLFARLPHSSKYSRQIAEISWEEKHDYQRCPIPLGDDSSIFQVPSPTPPMKFSCCQTLSYQHSPLVCWPGFISFIKHFYSRRLLIFLQRALSSQKLRKIFHFRQSTVWCFLHIFAHEWFFTSIFHVYVRHISENLIFNALKRIQTFLTLSPCRQTIVWWA